MTDERLDEMEREVLEHIEWLKREFQKAAQPFVEQLARIRALRPPPPIFITREQAEQLFGVTDVMRGKSE